MTEQETHFQRAESIAYEALSIALEKERFEHQKTRQREENLKNFINSYINMAKHLDLSPTKKEENGMDTFKNNK